MTLINKNINLPYKILFFRNSKIPNEKNIISTIMRIKWFPIWSTTIVFDRDPDDFIPRFFLVSFLHWIGGELYLWKALFSRVGRRYVIYIYIQTAVIVSADFIEGKNRTKPTHRWFLLYPIIHVFTPQELCSRTFSTGYFRWIYHSVLLRGRVIDAACERYKARRVYGTSSNEFRWCSNFQVLERGCHPAGVKYDFSKWLEANTLRKFS